MQDDNIDLDLIGLNICMQDDDIYNNLIGLNLCMLDDNIHNNLIGLNLFHSKLHAIKNKFPNVITN